jgi:hypothetical protein
MDLLSIHAYTDHRTVPADISAARRSSVVVQKRRAVAGREHVLGTARETGAASVLAEDGG